MDVAGGVAVAIVCSPEILSVSLHSLRSLRQAEPHRKPCCNLSAGEAWHCAQVRPRQGAPHIAGLAPHLSSQPPACLTSPPVAIPLCGITPPGMSGGFFERLMHSLPPGMSGGLCGGRACAPASSGITVWSNLAIAAHDSAGRMRPGTAALRKIARIAPGLPAIGGTYSRSYRIGPSRHRRDLQPQLPHRAFPP